MPAKKKPKKKSKPVKLEVSLEGDIEDIEDEFEKWGDEFGKRMEKHGKKAEKKWNSWWYNTFGVIAPLFSAFCTVIFLVITIFVLNFLNSYLNSIFIVQIAAFVYDYLAFFFLVSLVLGYDKYVKAVYPEEHWAVGPLFKSFGLTFFFWLVSVASRMVNIFVGGDFFILLANFISQNLIWLFLVFLFLGYAIALVGHHHCD